MIQRKINTRDIVLVIIFPLDHDKLKYVCVHLAEKNVNKTTGIEPKRISLNFAAMPVVWALQSIVSGHLRNATIVSHLSYRSTQGSAARNKRNLHVIGFSSLC